MDVSAGPVVSVDVLNLIDNSKEHLLLISPYFRPWGRLEQSIHNAVTVRGVNTTLLLRGGRDREKQEKAAKPFKKAGANIGFLKRLHAKVYLSETEAIVTSMNLLESSALDSWEIAMRVSKHRDSKLYGEIIQKCESMLHQASQETARHQAQAMRETLTAFASGNALATAPQTKKAASKSKTKRNKNRKSSSSKKSRRSKKKKSKSSSKGTCIRCSTSIKRDIERPLCHSCWKVWSKFKNKDYEEKYCLGCGKKHKSSFNKPMCYSCYKKYA